MIDRHWVSSMGLIRSHGTGHQPYRTQRRKALSKRSQRIKSSYPLSLIFSQDPPAHVERYWGFFFLFPSFPPKFPGCSLVPRTLS